MNIGHTKLSRIQHAKNNKILSAIIDDFSPLCPFLHFYLYPKFHSLPVWIFSAENSLILLTWQLVSGGPFACTNIHQYHHVTL